MKTLFQKSSSPILALVHKANTRLPAIITSALAAAVIAVPPATHSAELGITTPVKSTFARTLTPPSNSTLIYEVEVSDAILDPEVDVLMDSYNRAFGEEHLKAFRTVIQLENLGVYMKAGSCAKYTKAKGDSTPPIGTVWNVGNPAWATCPTTTRVEPAVSNDSWSRTGKCVPC